MPLYFGYDSRLRPGYCLKCGLIPDVEHPLTKQVLADSLDDHHIIAKMDGGPDTPENIASLCPACHKEWHAFEMRSKLSFYMWLKIPPAYMLALGYITGHTMGLVGKAHREHMDVSREFIEARRAYQASPAYHYQRAFGQSAIQKLRGAGVTEEELESLGSLADFAAFCDIVGRGIISRQAIKGAWKRFQRLRTEVMQNA